MTTGDDIAVVGDGLVLLGLIVTWVIYRRERRQAERRDLEAARGLLIAVSEAMPWGELYFGTGYTYQTARDRAQEDYDSVMKGSYSQVFRVPTEPLAALVSSPFAGGLIARETVQAAQIALWRIGVFNQLVQQQTDFNSGHISEFRDSQLEQQDRESLAEAARSISTMLHENGIGDAGWFATLKRELAANTRALDRTTGDAALVETRAGANGRGPT